MRPARLLSGMIAAAGACAVLVGVGWWAVIYSQVWSNDYLSLPQASRCLLADSSICRLAAALCTGQHRSFAAAYSPWVLRLGGAALLVGAGPLALVREARGTKSRT